MIRTVVKSVKLKKDFFGSFKKRMRQLEGSEVSAGLPEGGKFTHHPKSDVKTYEDLQKIAYVNEFGSNTIPERPFIREGTEAGAREVKNLLRRKRAQIIRHPESVDQVLAEIGDIYVNRIKEAIVTKTNPPNAPSTVKKKGFDDPLIETRQLHDNIQKKVTLRGKLFS